MLSPKEKPRKHPQITIDYKKCTTPFDCKKCVLVCATSVYSYQTVKMQRGKETDKHEPGAWQCQVMWPDKCWGCMDCVKACPQKAISIKFMK